MKCWNCNEDATITRPHVFYDKLTKTLVSASRSSEPITTQRCYCQKCFEEETKRLAEEDEIYLKLKKRRMFEMAVENLERQHISIYKYHEAIETVRKFVEENGDKFDSSYEMLAAIVLIHDHVKCKMQCKVGRYQIDMLLPDMFVALEIDGERHKQKKEYDSERDMTIKMILGSEWEIVRIKTDYLDQNAVKLLSAIKQICDYRAFKD